jgi:glutamyl-tRNA reductase
VQEIKLISFTHKSIGLEKLGMLHIENDRAAEVLKPFMAENQIEELVFLSTCNRVEFLLVSNKSIKEVKSAIIHILYQKLEAANKQYLMDACITFEGIHAVKQYFKVASSLESLVIGEREIITQVRSAYDRCAQSGLCGDKLRLVIKKTIEAAKQVFTYTEVANRPVSVVNLAFRKLKATTLNAQSKVLVVGAGKTNTALATQIKKHGIGDFHVFNRTFSKAQELANMLGGKAYELHELKSFTQGFDAIISCTGSADVIINAALYRNLLQGDTSKKILVDLAIPNDFEKTIISDFRCDYISVESLKAIAEENLKARSSEISKCENIIDQNIEEFEMLYRTRQIELAMKEVPKAVTDIKSRALEQVFAHEVSALDQQSQDVLKKVLDYMEKKYISMPMKMAREIMLGEVARK